MILGGTGDLSLRKLMPALYYICKDGFFHPASRMLSISRSENSRPQFLDKANQALQRYLPEGNLEPEVWQKFSDQLHYLQFDIKDDANWQDLVAWSKNAEPRETIYYQAVPPEMIDPICQSLAKHGLNHRGSRIVVEKRFGEDLQSAIAINDIVSTAFSERQIYRIDHYLGKEMVQNNLALRFGNRFLEKIWDCEHIEYI